MNNDRIADIRERCEAATPGPWKYDEVGYIWAWGIQSMAIAFMRGWGHLTSKLGLSDTEAAAQIDANAKFIAGAREDIPYLLEQLVSANAEIERLREAQRWIPVGERLPEVGGYYLTADDLEIVREAHFYAEHVNPSWMRFSATLKSITHWMPLPAAPKDEGGSRVNPKDGGPYSLFCSTCHSWVPNTASHEMRKEGYFAHSHSCAPEEGESK